VSTPRLSNLTVLVIGTGGREHALARALARDPAVAEVHAAPGNPGIANVATVHPLDQMSGAEVADLAVRVGADLVVVGPEAPLVAGVADAVTARGIPCFGPSGAAARLEGSKAFAKEVMKAAGVPTARAFVCTTPEEAAAALDELGAPYVVKDDGLAAGKGVVVTEDRRVAVDHAATCERVVIEEYLDGPEVSLFALCGWNEAAGATVYPLQPAQDFKRIFDGERGPNTGGMGAYTPLDWAPPGLVDEVLETVLRPTVEEMARRGTPFTGLLYAGLALTSRGTRVVEFNARFGDPETQALLALLDCSLAELLHGAATGTLADVSPPTWKPGAAVAVVLASKGYPESSSSGDVIDGIDRAEELEGVHVIQAGTARSGDDLVTAGGRVLAVVGTGADLAAAREAAYAGVAAVGFEGAQSRRDIAASAVRGVSTSSTTEERSSTTEES
jgi:phosphoribosylamine--glycine ligase